MRTLSVRFMVIVACMATSATVVLAAGTQQQARGQSRAQVTIPQADAPLGIIKWEEIFNTTTIPAGWRVIDNDSSGAAWAFRQLTTFTSGDTVRPQAGQSYWFSSFNNANSSRLIDEYIIGPRLPLIETGDTLHFYAGAIGGQYHDSLRVFVSTTDSALGSFTTQIGYFKVDGPTGSWHRYTFDLGQFVGTRPFIAVNYFIVDGGPVGNHSDNVWVDHFILENRPSTDVEQGTELPTTFSVSRNYPNPFNPSTTIGYDVAKPSMVKLVVYNLLGQTVRTLVSRQMEPGRYSAVWDGRNDLGQNVVSGAYLYRFEAGGVVQTQKMMLVK